MNISGNYHTEEREVEVVRRIFDEQSIPYVKIEKYARADDGDVCVHLEGGKTLLIEVKEERYNRFTKFGDLGIDYISAFQFKQGVNSDDWKRQQQPERVNEFWQSIDTSYNFKYGKVFYSKSDLWLFFVLDPDNDFYYCKFFDGAFMTSREFRDYLESNCQFTVNIKPPTQQSYYDRHNSACFFLNRNDNVLNQCEVDLQELIDRL